MTGFLFWKRVLFVVTLVISAFGLVLAFFNQSQLMDWAFNRRIDPAFWGDGGYPAEFRAFQSWVYGVLGATVAGWGIVMAFLVHHAFRPENRWAWNAFAVGISIWYICDSALSWYWGAGFNVLFNTLLLLAVGVPLLATRRYFIKRDTQ